MRQWWSAARGYRWFLFVGVYFLASGIGHLLFASPGPRFSWSALVHLLVASTYLWWAWDIRKKKKSESRDMDTEPR